MKTNDLNRGRRLWAFGAIACAAILIAIVFTVSSMFRGGQEPPRSFGSSARIAWHAGDQQSYDFRIASRMQLGLAAAGGAESVAQIIEGTLNMRVFETSTDEVSLGFQLQPVGLSVNGQSDPAQQLELGTAFGAVFSRDGRPVSFRFPTALQPGTRMRLEEVLRSFQVVVPPDAGAEWRSEEEHASGRYLAAYQRTGELEVQKTKLEYVAGAEMRDGAQLLGKATNRVASSSGRTVLASGASWIESAAWSEELVVITGPEAMFRAVTDAELRLQTETGGAGLALRTAADLPNLIADQQRTVSEQRVLSAPKPTAADIERFRDLVAAFNGSGGDDVDLLRKLAAELRAFPDLAAMVPDLLADPELVDRAAAGLIHVLELAGHGPAQESLAVVAEDPLRSHMNRIRAVIAGGSVEAPSEATLELLWQLASDRSSDDTNDLANTALLSLGRLGSTLLAMDSADYNGLRAGLADALAASFDEQSIAAALKAVANTRDPNLSLEAERYLSSHSPLVRASAAEAIGDLDGPTALDTLTTNLQRESNGRVRAAMVTGLGKLEQKSPATFAVVDAQLQSEKDEDSVHAMARYLADNLDTYPQGRRTLEKLIETVTEARTLQYVAGKLYR